MGSIIDKISKIGFVPLVTLDNADDSVPLAKALLKGGIPVAEVTFRTDSALESIKRIAQEVPEVILGAGTVTTIDQVKQAMSVGCQFIVMPGIVPEVVEYCVNNYIEIIPAGVTPRDILTITSYGLDTVKFFPAETFGGIGALKAFSGPFANIKFMPTGGVNEKNYVDYLKLPNVSAVGGSFLIPDKLIKEKKWDAISELCNKLLVKSLDFHIYHVGINTKDEDDSKNITDQLAGIFNVGVNEAPGAYFAGNLFEIIKGTYLGTHGHIGIGTPSVERAIYYLEAKGIKFNQDTFGYDEKGNIIACYFQDEIAGFAFHLRRA